MNTAPRGRGSANFFLGARLDQYREKVPSLQLIVACMLSGASRDRPVIVGWSTALRGQVINEKSRATPEETGSRPAPAGKDQIITQRIGDETGWTTARSLGEVGATSVHSKPVFVCSDCTFSPGLLNRPFHCMSQKNTRGRCFPKIARTWLAHAFLSFKSYHPSHAVGLFWLLREMKGGPSRSAIRC